MHIVRQCLVGCLHFFDCAVYNLDILSKACRIVRNIGHTLVNIRYFFNIDLNQFHGL